MRKIFMMGKTFIFDEVINTEYFKYLTQHLDHLQGNLLSSVLLVRYFLCVVLGNQTHGLAHARQVIYPELYSSPIIIFLVNAILTIVR